MLRRLAVLDAHSNQVELQRPGQDFVHSQEAVPTREAVAVHVADAGTRRSGVLGCGEAEYGERESVAIEAGDAAFFVVDGPAGDGVREDQACILPEALDVGFRAGIVVVYGFAHRFELRVEWGSGRLGGCGVCFCGNMQTFM